MAMTASGLAALEAQAQDASFGCKVLLCAAATNPDWAAIPYCVPPMEALFSELAKGDGWPPCPEGGETSGLGYDPYKPCPPPTQNISVTMPATTNYGGGDVSFSAGSVQVTALGAYCATAQGLQALNDAMTVANNPNTNNGNGGISVDTSYAYALKSGTPTSIPGISNALANPSPYYVDITLKGSATPQRFYFKLN